MTDIELLVKQYDNIFPVKSVKVDFMNSDGTIEERSLIEVDYEEGKRIRANMTTDEIDNQRTIL